MGDVPDIPAPLKESLDNTKVQYRQLGKSGLLVSVPIFGCMSFGDTAAQSWAINEEEVWACLLKYFLMSGMRQIQVQVAD
jgi:aryl-alcohol dehydrogenase-like predicted oxidoreductase